MVAEVSTICGTHTTRVVSTRTSKNKREEERKTHSLIDASSHACLARPWRGLRFLFEVPSRPQAAASEATVGAAAPAKR